jgi:hypothetical protein
MSGRDDLTFQMSGLKVKLGLMLEDMAASLRRYGLKMGFRSLVGLLTDHLGRVTTFQGEEGARRTGSLPEWQLFLVPLTASAIQHAS